MDVARLTKVVRKAESVNCEASDYRGLSLGLLLQSWPDEIASGRVSRGRSKTSEAQVIRAYVKFVKASAELAEAVADLGTPDVPLQFAREVPGSMYAAASGKSRGRGRSNSNAALALLPVSAASLSSGPEGQVSATSSLQQQQSSQLQSAHRGDSPRAASGLRGLSTQILLHSSAQGNQILDSMSSQDLELAGPNFAVHPSAMPQELPQSQPGVASRSQRVLVAAQLLGLPVSLLSRLAPGQPQDQSPFWRRWGIWLIGVLITTIAPRLLFQLLRLLAERLVSASVGTFWKVSTAATDEATDMFIRFVHFLEDTLGICLVEPEVTPTSVHAVGTAVQQAAATAAAQTVATTFAKQAAEGHLDPELVAKSVSQAVRAAVEASQTTAPHHSAPELGDWRLPGWVIFVAGVVINGFQHRVVPHVG